MTDDRRDEPDRSDAIDGAGLVNFSFGATGVVLVTAVGGVISPDGFGVVTAVASVVLFAIGSAMLLWAYAVGVARSRDDQVTLGGLFFLADVAPRVVRFRMRLAVALQSVIAIAAAAARPYTAVAFVVLAPMAGLGAMGLWGARHGTFGPREPRR